MKKNLLTVLSLASLLTVTGCSFGDLTSEQQSAVNSAANGLTSEQQSAINSAAESIKNSQVNESSQVNENSSSQEVVEKTNLVTAAIKNLIATKTVTLKLSGAFEAADGDNGFEDANLELTVSQDKDNLIKAYVGGTAKVLINGHLSDVNVIGTIENGVINAKATGLAIGTGTYGVDGSTTRQFEAQDYVISMPLELYAGTMHLDDASAMVFENYEDIYNYQVNSLYPFINGVIDYLETEISDVAKVIETALFDVTETATGYDVTLNPDKALALMKAVSNKKVTDVVDLILGAGKYAGYKSTISAFADKTVEEVLTELAAKGADVTKLANATATLVEKLTGKTIEQMMGLDPRTYLADKDLLATKVGAFIAQAADASSFEELFTGLTQQIEGTSIPDLTKYEETVSQVVTMAKQIVKTATIKVTKSGAIDSVNLAAAYSNEDTNIAFDVAAKITFADDKTLNYTTGVAEVTALTSKLALNKALVTALELDEDDFTFDAAGNISTFTNVYSSYTEVYDCTTVGWTLVSACGDYYEVAPVCAYTQTYNYGSETEPYNGVSEIYELRFIYNAKTGAILSTDGGEHTYVEDTTKATSVGTGCDLVETKYYTCSACHKEMVEVVSHGHDYEDDVNLIGDSCEDGWYYVETCSNCGEKNTDDKPYVYDYHKIICTYTSLEEYGIDAEISFAACPCGEESYGTYLDYDEDSVVSDDFDWDTCVGETVFNSGVKIVFTQTINQEAGTATEKYEIYDADGKLLDTISFTFGTR